MLEILPTPPPFLPPLQAIKRIDRFNLLDARQLTGAPDKMPKDAPDVMAALTRLSAEGLLAAVSKGSHFLILGGTGKSTDSGITVYHDGFTISRERDGSFLAGVAGPGNHSEQVPARTLSEATDAVLSVYRSRGILGR